MTEILIIAISLFFSFALFIYFSTKSKDLNIKILNEEELKIKLEQEIQNLQQGIKRQNDYINERNKENEQLIKQNMDLRKLNTQLESTMKSTVKEAVTKARADSVKRQRSILKGQATEQLAPYINSKYNPKDYKFIGDPIDYIVFDGMSDIKQKDDEINKIILMDIKTGKSQLNRVQKAVKKCIEAGNVEFQVYRPEKDIEDKRLENENIQPPE